MVTLLRRTHTSRVNVRHLLDDLASGYSYSLEEAVIVELVANSLDAKSSEVRITLDQKDGTLTVEDDGGGMDQEEFEKYHDLAESRKVRGRGIGFAGLGAKLGHKVARKVVTETRSGPYRDASQWAFRREELLWKRSRVRDLRRNGTRVTLFLRRRWQQLLDRDFVERALRYHYGPLLDPYLSQLYLWESVYPQGVAFYIDGTHLPPKPVVDLESVEARAEVDIRGRRKRRIGRAVFVLAQEPFPEEDQGIAIATYGKTIRKDNLGIFPKRPEYIAGWIECPGLVECLTLDKQNFLTQGKEGLLFRRIRRDLQKAFTTWLQEIGEVRESEEPQRAPRRLERETSNIIRRIPELRYLYMAQIKALFAEPDTSGDEQAELKESTQLTHGIGPGDGGGEGMPITPGDQEGQALQAGDGGTARARTRSRNIRIGPRIERTADSERADMSWIEGDMLFINTAHPTFQLAERRGLLGYHERFAIYHALCQEAPIDPEEKLSLLVRALTEWSRS